MTDLIILLIINILAFTLFISYKPIRKYFRFRSFTKNDKKFTIVEGFGLVLNGDLIYGKDHTPLLFENYFEAKEYGAKRDFGKKNGLNTLGQEIKVVWQKWNLTKQIITVHKVKVQEA